MKNKKIILLVSTLLATSLSLFSSATSADDFTAKQTKIIGGTKAAFGSWPSTVALLNTAIIKRIEAGNAIDGNDQITPVNRANYQAQFCGASLIAPDWVLTAAHCIKSNSVDKITTLIGAFNLIGDGYRRELKKIIIHPNYISHSDGTSENDLALLQLKTKVNVDTISIASKDAPNGTLATAVGWGAFDGTSEHYPSELYEVELPVIDQSICRSYFPNNRFSSSTMLCAGYLQGDKRDVCNGDSGGPLMARIDNGGYKQIGITSWGASCSDLGSYGAYTRLSKYKSWINSKISPPKESSGGGSMLFLLLPFFILMVATLFPQKKIKVLK